jgi:hypothetical protein
MTAYLGKDGKLATPTKTAPNAAVPVLTRRIENVGNKLCTDKFFSSPELFDNLQTKAINFCGTVGPN